MSNQRKRPQPSLRVAAAQREAEADAKRARRRQGVLTGVVVGIVVLAAGAGFAMTLRGGGSDAPAPPKVASSAGCLSCHSTSGARSEGPTWKGLYGSQVTLADGRTVTADEAYLRRSILEPQADIAAGAMGTMPTVQLTQKQVDQIVAYIEEL